jgi:thiosulfate dehydrogenase
METGRDEKYVALTRVIKQLTTLVSFLVLLVITLLIFIGYLNPVIFTSTTPKSTETASTASVPAPVDPNAGLWKAPDIASLEGSPDKEKILYGKDLIAITAEYFGPNGKVKKNATNGMNCQNCHLDAGTRPFGNNYASVFSTYPRYRGRSGTIEDIYKRVNDCFERSLNGEPLDTNSKEMQAMVAYINWLGKDVPKGEKAAGSGLKDLAFLDRAADPGKGKIGYEAKCQSCHMANGEGQINPEKTAYTFPPLWGSNSYNDGAGLFRISTFAKYIKYNMPLGATHSNTMLSDEEAWDIAAFVNSQPRPKKDISKDWPKIEEKPIDHPFGPFADGFDEKQHKYGPFQPIADARKKNK